MTTNPMQHPAQNSAACSSTNNPVGELIGDIRALAQSVAALESWKAGVDAQMQPQPHGCGCAGSSTTTSACVADLTRQMDEERRYWEQRVESEERRLQRAQSLLM